jgi:hypothetical protein
MAVVAALGAQPEAWKEKTMSRGTVAASVLVVDRALREPHPNPVQLTGAAP